MTAAEKFKFVMNEFRDKTLKLASGKTVTSIRQAVAIAFSEARKIAPAFSKKAQGGFVNARDFQKDLNSIAKEIYDKTFGKLIPKEQEKVITKALAVQPTGMGELGLEDSIGIEDVAYAKGGSVQEHLHKAHSHLGEVGTKLSENKNIRVRAFRKEYEKFDNAIDDLLPNRYTSELGYAKGGMTEHGLETGDNIVHDLSKMSISGKNKVEVREWGTDKKYQVDLDKGERKPFGYAKGGSTTYAGGGEIIEYVNSPTKFPYLEFTNVSFLRDKDRNKIYKVHFEFIDQIDDHGHTKEEAWGGEDQYGNEWGMTVDVAFHGDVEDWHTDTLEVTPVAETIRQLEKQLKREENYYELKQGKADAWGLGKIDRLKKEIAEKKKLKKGNYAEGGDLDIEDLAYESDNAKKSAKYYNESFVVYSENGKAKTIAKETWDELSSEARKGRVLVETYLSSYDKGRSNPSYAKGGKTDWIGGNKYYSRTNPYDLYEPKSKDNILKQKRDAIDLKSATREIRKAIKDGNLNLKNLNSRFTVLEKWRDLGATDTSVRDRISLILEDNQKTKKGYKKGGKVAKKVRWSKLHELVWMADGEFKIPKTYTEEEVFEQIERFNNANIESSIDEDFEESDDGKHWVVQKYREIDYAKGGGLGDISQTYNIQQGQFGGSSVNPSQFQEGGYIVWVGDTPIDIGGREELTKEEADRIAKEWRDKGYDDVIIDKYAKGGKVKRDEQGRDEEEARDEIYNDAIQEHSELGEIYEGDELQGKIEIIVDKELKELGFADGGKLGEGKRAISLYFQQGASDKEYHAQLEKQNGGYVVNFQYGRAGYALNSGTKTPKPILLGKAIQLYEKLVTSKMHKGYQEGPLKTSGPSRQIKPKAKIKGDRMQGSVGDVPKKYPYIFISAAWDGDIKSPPIEFYSTWDKAAASYKRYLLGANYAGGEWEMGLYKCSTPGKCSVYEKNNVYKVKGAKPIHTFDYMQHLVAKVTIGKEKIDIEDEPDTTQWASGGSVRYSANRKSPSDSATSHPLYFKMRGNDGNTWEVMKASNGVKRWVKVKDVPEGTIGAFKSFLESIGYELEDYEGPDRSVGLENGYVLYQDKKGNPFIIDFDTAMYTDNIKELAKYSVAYDEYDSRYAHTSDSFELPVRSSHSDLLSIMAKSKKADGGTIKNKPLTEEEKVEILKEFRSWSGGEEPENTLWEWEVEQDEEDNIPAVKNFVSAYASNYPGKEDSVDNYLHNLTYPDHADGGEIEDIKSEIQKLKKENREGYKDDISRLELRLAALRLWDLGERKDHAAGGKVSAYQQFLDHGYNSTAKHDPKTFVKKAWDNGFTQEQIVGTLTEEHGKADAETHYYNIVGQYMN